VLRSNQTALSRSSQCVDSQPPARTREQHCSRRQPADQPDQASGDEVHRVRERWPRHAAIELAGHGQIGGEIRVLQMREAGRADRHLRQPVVQIRRGAIAQVVAHRRLDRRQHLQQHEGDSDKAERAGQRLAALHGIDEAAHRHGKERRQQPVQPHHHPPGQRQAAVGPEQRREEQPLLPLPQPPQHRQGPR
jgi:hypothetical protein